MRVGWCRAVVEDGVGVGGGETLPGTQHSCGGTWQWGLMVKSRENCEHGKKYRQDVELSLLLIY